MRVSDAERAKVGQLLETAVAQGMITLDEFSERYDTALAARTRGELNAVLADLPMGGPLSGVRHPRNCAAGCRRSCAAGSGRWRPLCT